LYAGTEERHGANGSPGERRALRAVAVAREADDARMRARRPQNASAETGGDRRRVFHLAVDAWSGERDAGDAGEFDGAALDAGMERITVLLDRPLGPGLVARESQYAGHETIANDPEGLLRNIVVVGFREEAE